jgi:hypothetical protein
MFVLPDGDVRVTVRDRLVTAVAVAVARRVVKLPPARIAGFLTRVRGTVPAATYAEAKRARDTVLAVSVRCCGRKACLVRSVATVLVCRARGSWATWCAGVLSAPPFRAHAWVEADGTAVDEYVDGTPYTKLCSV